MVNSCRDKHVLSSQKSSFTKFVGVVMVSCFLTFKNSVCQHDCNMSLEYNFKNSRLMLATLLKKRLWHRCFPVSCAKFSRKPFTEHLRWLLL